MKILTRKQQNKLLQMIAENEKIMLRCKVPPFDFDTFISNNCEMAYIIDDLKGVKLCYEKVHGRRNWSN